ncbi:MAG: hypothetical protein KA105_01125 [Caulobacter sp.]|nr:hypothetical protein [Caulobacter sp.]
MTPIRLLTAAAFSALLAGAAVAQDAGQPVDDTMPSAPPTASDTPPVTEESNTPMAPAAEQSATPASGVVRQSSPTPVDQAYTLKAGDPSVVSNGPVPDTAENRAKYGAPISNGGKRTKPAGN